jgi:acetylornithine deacetylase
MHKGVSMDALTITGRAGHSSDPRLGANAIDGMHAAIAELMSFRDDLKSRYPNAAFDPPYPTMNLGHIHGGDNPNRICGRCELHYDLRSMPGMDAATLREELARRVSTRLNGSGLTFEIRNLDSAIPAFESPPGGVLVRALEAITGNKARAAPFGTEAPFFAQLGMEAIVCGPGDIGCAHQPDEYLALARIAPARDMLNRLIRKFCLA